MSLSQKRLLVVDDNPVNVSLMMCLLETYGFHHVEGISDPRVVVQHCTQQPPPDLVLLDIRMPYLSGYDVIRLLQQQLGDKTPPIIVLTAQVDESTRHRALELGVRDFIEKPFDEKEVLQRIRNVLEVEMRYQRRDQQVETLSRLVAKRTRELEKLSHADPVTGLPNRRGLLDKLRRFALAGQGAGLLFFTLDGLEDIAHLHGHGVAEKLLRHVGQKLRQALAETHYIGLWGGNGLLVITDVKQPDALGDTAEALACQLEQSVYFDELLLSVRSRVGISIAERSFDSERLVQKATLAVPSSDASVRWQVYSETFEMQHRRRVSLQQAMRHAISHQQLRLVYQPKLSLATQRIIGAEALLRWEHPDYGAVSPGIFIPLAESSGEIIAIGEWVIQEAVRQIARWRHAGLLDDDFAIAINVAARQLGQAGFAASLLETLARESVPPCYVSVEVTESGLMQDLDNARSQLRKLRTAGVRIAIDDFGTGYSSLAYLKTLPVNTLKIDRSFIIDLTTSAADQRLARTVTVMAHGFGCDVVAEGIETAEQATLLNDIGCEYAQGFLYSRPLEAQAFAEWCSSWQQAAPRRQHCM